MALWHEGPHRGGCGLGPGAHRARHLGPRGGDVTEGNSLLHGQETDAFGDAGYQGIAKRLDAKDGVAWHIAMKPSQRRLLLSKDKTSDVLTNYLEKLKAGIRAKVEHPFRVVKRQFGYAKVRYRGLNPPAKAAMQEL